MLKRSEFKRKAPVRPAADPDRVRSTPTATPGAWRTPQPIAAPAAPVPKEAEAARPGKRAPTKAERSWMDAIVEHGCICCVLDGHAPRPTAVHHILRGGQRIGHLFTLPACDPGHHQGGSPLGLLSRHPYKAQWEAKYGTELELLALLQEKLGWPKTVVVQE